MYFCDNWPLKNPLKDSMKIWFYQKYNMRVNWRRIMFKVDRNYSHFRRKWRLKKFFEKLKVYLLPEFLRYQLYYFCSSTVLMISRAVRSEFAISMHIAWNLEKTLISAEKSWVLKSYLVSQFSKIRTNFPILKTHRG